MKRNFFLAAILAATLALSAPLSAGALPAHEYEARLISIKDAVDGGETAVQVEGGGYEDTLSSGAYTMKAQIDSVGYITNITVQYGERTVYDGSAGFAMLFDNSLYIYYQGVLKFFENGGVKTVLTVDESLTCAGISDEGGAICAYFMDAPSRDFYAYNLGDGTHSKLNIGESIVNYYPFVKHGTGSDTLRRTGDYVAIMRRDEGDDTLYETILKFEGEALTLVEPAAQNAPNANPSGEELMLFVTKNGCGYLDKSGEVAGYYDDATAFVYNEDGAGVALVTIDKKGYFVDQYLNVVSNAIESFYSFLKDDNTFGVWLDEDYTRLKLYEVELVPKGSAGTPLFGIMRPLGSAVAW